MHTTAARIPTAFAALFLAALLALSAAAPSAAYAETLIAAQDTTAGTADAAAGTLAAPATTTLYVIKSLGSTKFSYNKKGQLVKQKSAGNGTKTTVKFTYKKNRIASFKSTSKSKYQSASTSSKVTYDANGRMKKVAGKGSSPYKLKYAYNASNQVVKETGKRSGNKISQAFAYDAKGRVSTITSPSSTTTVKYNKRNNIKSVTTKYGKFDLYTGYKYTYEDGRVASRGVKYTEAGTTYYASAVAYREITVPTKYVSQVQAQQYALMNPSVSFALPR